MTAATAVDPHAERVWSPAQLRLAISLGYGVNRAGGPDLAAFAASLGVSTRTAQRWMKGASQPRHDRLAEVRAALQPDAAVLERQVNDQLSAQAAAKAIKARRGMNPVWRQQLWHKPHYLYIVDNAQLGISRPVIALVGRAKPAPLGRAWERVDVVHLPTYPAAVLVRYELLQQMSPWRVKVHRSLVPDGHSMCWLTVGQTPLVSAVAVRAGWR